MRGNGQTDGPPSPPRDVGSAQVGTVTGGKETAAFKTRLAGSRPHLCFCCSSAAAWNLDNRKPYSAKGARCSILGMLLHSHKGMQ